MPGEVDATSAQRATALAAIGRDRSPILLWFALLLFVLLGSSGFYAWWHKTREIEATGSSRMQHATVSAATSRKAPATPAPPVAKVAAPPVAIPTDRLQLDIAVTEQTWLSLSSDGKRIFSGVLLPNQTKTLEGRESATLKVGNAAGLEVRPLADLR